MIQWLKLETCPIESVFWWRTTAEYLSCRVCLATLDVRCSLQLTGVAGWPSLSFHPLDGIFLTEFPHTGRVGLVFSLLQAVDDVLQSSDVHLEVHAVFLLSCVSPLLECHPHDKFRVASLQEGAGGESCLEPPVQPAEVEAGQAGEGEQQGAELGRHHRQQVLHLTGALRVLEDVVQDLRCLCWPALALYQGSQNEDDCRLLSRHPIRLSHLTHRGWCQDFFHPGAELYHLVWREVTNILYIVRS